MNPDWISAAADMATAAEKGYAVFRNKKSEAKDETAPPPVPVPVAGPTASAGLTNEALIMAAFIVAAAIVLAALVMHHALTAV